MKKQLLLFILTLLPMLAMADANGSCGTNVTYTFVSSTGTLTIQGSGAMTNYASSYSRPWYAYRTDISSVIIEEGVTSIGNYAFSGCSGLTSATIPNSVTTIGEYAFYGCSNLPSVVINDNITSIGEYSFFGCGGLTSIIVEGGNAFYNSNNQCNAIIETSTNTLVRGCKTTTIPNDVKSIGIGAFSSCNDLTSISIPNSVTIIYGGAFDSCRDLTSVTIPNSVTSIGYGIFYGCSSLTSITIPNSVTSIPPQAFYNCSSLISITIPNGVTLIDSDAFNNCMGLTSITIPNSVSHISGSAFEKCSSLTSINLPNSLTYIGGSAFKDCTSLVSVNSQIETPFAFGSSAFNNVPYTCVLTVPKGTRDAYIAAGWTESVFRGGVVENDNVAIAMETGSGAPRTMIGYSSQYSLDFTGINDVKAYIVIGFTDTKGVLMARVNVVPANTGVVLKSDVAGVEVEVPITTSDVYYANLLKPAVNNVTIDPIEVIDGVNYTNLMVGKLANEQMGFVTLPSSNTYSNKCYLQIPTAFYESATSARDGGMEIVFVDDETTDIRSLMHNGSATNDAYYDLQGRKVIPGKKGIYIHNGKKVFVR